jgi:hypothetical protein
LCRTNASARERFFLHALPVLSGYPAEIETAAGAAQESRVLVRDAGEWPAADVGVGAMAEVTEIAAVVRRWSASAN